MWTVWCIYWLCDALMYIQYITDHLLNSIQIIQVISKVGDLVGIKYFPVEQEKTASVDKQKKLQWAVRTDKRKLLLLICKIYWVILIVHHVSVWLFCAPQDPSLFFFCWSSFEFCTACIIIHHSSKHDTAYLITLLFCHIIFKETKSLLQPCKWLILPPIENKCRWLSTNFVPS
jgi:hypothetical protein